MRLWYGETRDKIVIRVVFEYVFPRATVSRELVVELPRDSVPDIMLEYLRRDLGKLSEASQGPRTIYVDACCDSLKRLRDHGFRVECRDNGLPCRRLSVSRLLELVRPVITNSLLSTIINSVEEPGLLLAYYSPLLGVSADSVSEAVERLRELAHRL